MSAPLPPGHTKPLDWLRCSGNPCTCPKPEQAAATAEQTVADLLALCGVYEQKPIAHQWIRPSVIRSIIESGAAE